MATMKLEGLLPFRTALCWLALTIMSTYASGPDSGLTQEYCSSENTGSDYSAVYNQFQSDGSCFTQCEDDYAFAVVQYHYCWCSNYIPAEVASMGSCNQQCPGFPAEYCGNEVEGMFGYIALSKAPSGTAGVVSSTKSSSPPSSTSASTREVSQTVNSTMSPSSSTVVSNVTPTPSSTNTPSYSTPTSSHTRSTASPVTSVHVKTVSGSVVTQTVTTTPLIVAPSNAADAASIHRHGISRGVAAGVVVGSLIGLAAILVAAFIIWRRRAKSDTEAGETSGRPRRGGSVLSRTGLLGGVRPQSMSENAYEDPYSASQPTRPSSARHSMMFGASMVGDGVQGTSPLGSSNQDTASGRRLSKPLVYDQRLNPSALFANHDNGSRVSIQDQQDYSRPLGVANPDMRHSFDSR